MRAVVTQTIEIVLEECFALTSCIASPICQRFIGDELNCAELEKLQNAPSIPPTTPPPTTQAGPPTTTPEATYPLLPGWSSALATRANGETLYYYYDEFHNTTWNRPNDYSKPALPPTVAPMPTPKDTPSLGLAPGDCYPSYEIGGKGTVLGEHIKGCSFVDTSTHPVCARDGYLKLRGSQGDIYFDESRVAVRIQPHGSVPNDPTTPTVTLALKGTFASKQTGKDGNNPIFGPSVGYVPFTNDSISISCAFTDEEEKASFTVKHGSATLVLSVSVSKKERTFRIDGQEEEYHIPAGVMKITVDITGMMLKDNVWPGDADHFLFDFEIFVNLYPNSHELIKGKLANTIIWTWSDGSVFTETLLKWAELDGVSEQIVVALSEQLINVDPLNPCIRIPQPLSLPRYYNTLFYDPDISLVYKSGDDEPETNNPQKPGDLVLGPEKVNDDGSSDEGGSNAGLIVGIVFGVVICLACVLLGALAVRRSRRHKDASEALETRQQARKEMSPAANDWRTQPEPASSLPSVTQLAPVSSTPTSITTGSDYTSVATQREGGDTYTSPIPSIDNFAYTPHASTELHTASATPTHSTSYASALNSAFGDAEPSAPLSTLDISSRDAVSKRIEPSASTNSASVFLVADVASAANGADPRALASAVKALVSYAAPPQDPTSSLRMACIELGQAARTACVAMPIDAAQATRLSQLAEKVGSLKDAAV
eukprot:CAMPEP_0168602528 /NCGR_PEP_ID=MMETSP0420-20121227/14155_1 /TAXON_ID=498008 /ORGANISM="Pessonella sp." /LENGTH=712 /DNA_ID=CAMNT_0008641271 /DNA_START=391 /DNA_END=2530 /DNA_ORIENTATION=+